MAKSTKKKFKINRVLSLLTIISSIYLIYNILLLGPIEPLIRYILIGIITIINIILLIFSYKKGSNIKNILLAILIVLYSTPEKDMVLTVWEESIWISCGGSFVCGQNNSLKQRFAKSKRERSFNKHFIFYILKDLIILFNNF